MSIVMICDVCETQVDHLNWRLSLDYSARMFESIEVRCLDLCDECYSAVAAVVNERVTRANQTVPPAEYADRHLRSINSSPGGADDRETSELAGPTATAAAASGYANTSGTPARDPQTNDGGAA